MSSLLTKLAKAKSRLFGSAPEAIPVPFEVPCDCGHRVTGIRRTSYQIAVCSACQSSIFVLPVNVYPTTKRIRSEVVDGPVLERVGTVVRDLVRGDDPPEADESQEPRSVRKPQESVGLRDYGAAVDLKPKGRKSKRSFDEEGSRSGGGAEVNAQEPVAAIPLVQVPRPSFATRMRRVFSPTRLLALAGCIILCSTGFWTIHQRKLEQARKVWRLEMDRAETALKQKDLSALSESLILAVKAAKTLSRTDEDARVAESLLRQTESVQQLTSIDLVSQFSNAIRNDGSLDVAKAGNVAEGLKGQRFVFEMVLKRRMTGTFEFQLDFPLIIHDIPIDVFVSSSVLSSCVVDGSEPNVLFTACVRECRAPSPANRRWEIVLDGASCTLVTTEFHAEQLGFDLKASTTLQAVLDNQSKIVRSVHDSVIDSTLPAEGGEKAGKEAIP
ncbi:MAG: hypothetical protein U0936_23180 [Planctomycetaceae bacterium]